MAIRSKRVRGGRTGHHGRAARPGAGSQSKRSSRVGRSVSLRRRPALRRPPRHGIAGAPTESGETGPLLVVTSGEPAGIGLDICLALVGRRLPARIVVAADRGALANRAKHLGVAVDLVDFRPGLSVRGRQLAVLHEPAPEPVAAGRLCPANSTYVLRLLDRAAQSCARGEFDGMVTAPVHKGVINDAGIAFTGHTEYLAERLAAPQPVMMLVGGGLRVALATTHLPIAQVVRAITRAGLESVIRVLERGLRIWFGIQRPRIVVAGLNPHAGESGHLGREELDVIIPVLERMRAEGMDLIGPSPADTLFHPTLLQGTDAVLAMFHDQGLPVLKYASFGRGVNVTLGLPIIRTSVDHGTALELAGTGKADASSLVEAIDLAAAMARRAQHAAGG